MIKSVSIIQYGACYFLSSSFSHSFPFRQSFAMLQTQRGGEEQNIFAESKKVFDEVRLLLNSDGLFSCLIFANRRRRRKGKNSSSSLMILPAGIEDLQQFPSRGIHSDNFPLLWNKIQLYNSYKKIMDITNKQFFEVPF